MNFIDIDIVLKYKIYLTNNITGFISILDRIIRIAAKSKDGLIKTSDNICYGMDCDKECPFSGPDIMCLKNKIIIKEYTYNEFLEFVEYIEKMEV